MSRIRNDHIDQRNPADAVVPPSIADTRSAITGNAAASGAVPTDVSGNSVETGARVVARAAEAGLPNLDLRSADVQREINALLDRAGLTRGPNNAIVVRDTASVGRSAEVSGLNNAEQIYGTGESQLRPAMPPRVEMTTARRNGAISFAQNVDRAMNDFLVSPGGRALPMDAGAALRTGTTQLELQYRGLQDLSADALLAAFMKLNINDPNNAVETHNKLYEVSTELRQLAIDEAKKKIERAQEAMKEAQAYASQAQYISNVVTVISVVCSVFTMGASLAAMGATQAAQQSIVEAVKAAVKNAVQSIVDKLKSLALEAGQEIAQETMQQITSELAQQVQQQVQEQLAQQFMEQAKQQGVQLTQEMANKMAVEAMQANPALMQEMIAQSMQEYVQQGVLTQAQADQIVSQTMSQIQTINAQALSSMQNLATPNLGQTQQVLSPNATAMERLQHMGGQMLRGSGQNPTLRAIGIGVNAGGRVVEGGAQAQAADKMADAKEFRVQADRARMRADMHQDQIQRSGDVIHTIMESKNQTVDAVIQMMNASFATQQQLMSANMSR